MNQQRLSFLIDQMISERATEMERIEMLDLMDDPQYEDTVKDLLFEAFKGPKDADQLDPTISGQILDAILCSVDLTESEIVSRPIFQANKWLVMAASVAIVVIGLVFFKYNKKDAVDSGAGASVAKKQDIAPGDYGATLTLANGKKIRLADASNGEVAKEAGISITKTADGQLVYSIEKSLPVENGMNTISTAKGEIYKISLPDGTSIHLNAASSLSYKTSLIEEGKRVVSLKGEGYFEVAKDKRHPFIVKTEHQEVEVLGTHFNISSYPDDDVEKTTLLEGSVKLWTGDMSRVLKPGQQCKLRNGKFTVAEVDTDIAVAWKNNEFMFESEHIEELMKMVERWYNVEVIYVGEKTTERFSGGVSRFDNVSKVLNIVEATGASHFTIKGRKIYVSK